MSNKGEHKFILTTQDVGNLSLKISKKYDFKIYEISKYTIFEIIKISKRHEQSEWNKVSVKIKNLPVIFKMKF
ncbi:MAG: hypothetical protein GW779_03000 [Candidatus Altiarchaeum hamiconexum]|uniref:Uncharacterized protein n=1 Tax=Candidatus Altarchaeum hamiconexum TaxID=1803513 RepID=A0A8J7YZA0_9ARCH|nr:hypothetical protein [Candidatus Altarchaeum hamiconexum]PIV28737.1 MAG: hypothetical protein COS36_01195 [Candidatus Altarchaeum sp. CG03_land_8_20_14_0_80_32_618]PIX48130.1 MAG: hypothetical protein COZ53_04980 [Candidatus Altarchaeum sp. CG_4_8_14_3_um_filter_33_2054]PIZ30079.1 MAG: hypothetical protein COY41_04660 [Candidatus Altarchaeum sp. CG_4_10_14_0_8_um_filter_32_851]NCN68375.1 hypothetical protein [Candidatus Altarchaeum hamiconexum]